MLIEEAKKKSFPSPYTTLYTAHTVYNKTSFFFEAANNNKHKQPDKDYNNNLWFYKTPEKGKI